MYIFDFYLEKSRRLIIDLSVCVKTKRRICWNSFGSNGFFFHQTDRNVEYCCLFLKRASEIKEVCLKISQIVDSSIVSSIRTILSNVPVVGRTFPLCFEVCSRFRLDRHGNTIASMTNHASWYAQFYVILKRRCCVCSPWRTNVTTFINILEKNAYESHYHLRRFIWLHNFLCIIIKQF